MSIVAFIDLIAAVGGLAALLILAAGWRAVPRLSRDGKLIIFGLLLLNLFRDASNILEWTGAYLSLDFFEDFAEILVPLAWGFILHATVQEDAAQNLRDSEERYRSLVENTLDGYFIAELPEGRFLFVNQRICNLFGYTSQEVMALSLWEAIAPEDHRTITERVEARMRGEKIAPEEQVYRAIRKDGSTFLAEVSGSRIVFQGKTVIQGLLRDVTERQQLKLQLQQAQRMEAVGTLAGGIAHDFNNLLMAIQGNVSLMLFDAKPPHPYYERLKAIQKQVRSGAKLTSQLLGYARKGRYEVRPMSLNRLVEATAETFGRARKAVAVRLDLEGDLCAVEADDSQIEQVLLNLYVNASDAMPRGGDLIVTTRNAKSDELKDKPYAVKPGPYVLLTVTDTGTGMDEKTVERIFEPFFTTKEMGRGTGLGLASVYGIVKGHGGYIDVESAPGRGSTFRVYLPATQAQVDEAAPAPEGIRRGKETILLVDDEDSVLDVGRQILESLGYRVIAAKSGDEAIDLYGKEGDAVSLIILDLVMPGMDGGAVFDRIKEANPQAKILLSSGYSIESRAGEVMERGCNGFIQKPFTPEHLSNRIREILDGK
ncbi:MAG: PAS domain S-box protein [Deltaproteobacteria bacterium]|nr:PAS domain S-box protein [Deltaproteobacteria bacterium]